MPATATVSKKMRDITVDEYVSRVLGSDSDLEKKVKMNDIDAKDVLGKAKPSFDKYSVGTGVSFGCARLREAIEKKNSSQIKGIAAGQRDRYGTNTPVRIPVIRSNNDHLEVVLWGTSIKVGDAKVELTFPSLVTFNVVEEKSDKYESLRLVDAETYTPMNIVDAVDKLSSVAIGVGELSNEDLYKVVVVRGKIAFVGASPKFQNKEKVGDWGVYLENQRDHPQKHVVLKVTLASENNQQARITFERQRNAVPAIYVEDLEALCSDAASSDDDPNTQARIVGQGIKDRDVIVVGCVTKHQNYEGMAYYDIGAYGIYDAVVERQATLVEKEDLAPGKDDIRDTASKGATQSASHQPEAAAKPSGKTRDSKISKKDAAKDVILKFAQMTGAKGDSLDPDFLKANLTPLNDITPSVIRAAIDELKDEGELN